MNDSNHDQPTPYDDFPEINSYDEIPAFDSEDDEDEFWSTHTLGPGILKTMEQVSVAERLAELKRRPGAKEARRHPRRREGSG